MIVRITILYSSLTFMICYEKRCYGVLKPYLKILSVYSFGVIKCKNITLSILSNYPLDIIMIISLIKIGLIVSEQVVEYNSADKRSSSSSAGSNLE